MYELSRIIFFIKKTGKSFSQELEINEENNVLDLEKTKKTLKKYQYPVIYKFGLSCHIRKNRKSSFFKFVGKFYHLPTLFTLVSLFLFFEIQLSGLQDISSSPKEAVILPIISIFIFSFFTYLYCFFILFHQFILGRSYIIMHCLQTTQTEYEGFDENKLRKSLKNPLATFIPTLIKLFYFSIISFSLSYWALQLLSPSSFKADGIDSPKTIIDFIYYSITLITTTGAGPIYPNCSLAKVLVIMELVVALSIITFGITLFTTNIQKGISIKKTI